MTRLLIIVPSPLAEIVHGLQVATSIKAQWPRERGELEIHWVVRDIFAPLVRASPVVDRCIVFKRYGGTLDFLRLTREVRETRYDFLFDFQGLLRTGLLTWRAHAKKKVGRANAREGAVAFYNVKIQPPAGRRSHKLEVLLQFCAVLGLEPMLVGSLRFRGLERLKLDFVRGTSGLRPLVMFPDAKRDEKNWPGFKQLTKLILQGDRSRRVVWVGEKYFADKSAFPEARFLNLTGNTSLLSLPSLLKQADWVIANDCGPLHLAASLGVNVLGIYGPTDPRSWGPFPLTSRSNRFVQAPVGNLRLLQAKEVYARFLAFSNER